MTAYSYIDFEYQPDKNNDFIALIWLRGDAPIEKLAEHVAAESSVGTWTDVKTMNKYVWEHYRARVFKIIKSSAYSGFVYIAYPLEHFDKENLLQFCASVMGNWFGMKVLREGKLLDIYFPKKYQKLFKGPINGLKGVRKYLGTKKRPHVGTIIKPKVGLAPKEFARVAYEAYCGGVDLVKDDENLVNQDFCKFEERFYEVYKALDKAEKETGEKKMYLINITDSYSKMLERIDFLREHGYKMVMLDVVVIGYSALLDIIEILRKYGFIVHAHRAGHAGIDRGPFGINFYVFEKLYRLIGVDQLHVGTGVGKMEGEALFVNTSSRILRESKIEEDITLLTLGQDWSDHIKSVFPVASGGLHPGLVECVVKLHTNDVVIQAGGGIHGHPRGTYYGAKALREAIDAVELNIPLPEYAKTHRALREALEKWGYKSPDRIIKKLEFVKENKEICKIIVETYGLEGFEVIENMI